MNIEYKDLIKKETKIKILGEGLWVDEPDYAEFEHCGMKCFVIRIAFPDGPKFGGHFCGYVEIPSSHPLYGKDLICDEENDFEVHGGVTHSEYHVFFEKYLVGFDCGHTFDVIPSQEKIYSEIYSEIEKLKEKLFTNSKFLDRSYKDIDFVIKETKKLAEQLKDKEKENGK